MVYFLATTLSYECSKGCPTDRAPIGLVCRLADSDTRLLTVPLSVPGHSIIPLHHGNVTSRICAFNH